MMTSSSELVASLRRFGYHLEQAVHDALHEEGDPRSIVHFWDDDCLHIPTFGFEELLRRDQYPAKYENRGVLRASDSRTQEDLTTQAMFSAGYLGPVSMLAPHRSEYFSQVTQRGEKKQAESYASRLDAFLAERHSELASFDSAVPSLQKFARRGREADSASAVELIRKVEPWTFVVMEATANPWPMRLRRLLESDQLVDLDTPILPTSEEILASENFQNIYRGLQRMGGKHRTVATAIDAAALTSLTILVSRAIEERVGTFPRFYTSSLRLRRLFDRERWFRDLLSFPIASDTHRARSGTVWRDPYYYQLRVRFPALRPIGSVGRRDIGLTLRDLAELSDEVNRAIVGGAQEMQAFLLEHRLPDARPLIDVVSSLESLGMADVWLGRRPKDYIEYWTSGLTAIQELSSLEQTEEVLRREFVSAANSVVAQFSLYAAQFDVIVAVAKALGFARREAVKEPLAAVKNLGLERWGVSLPPAEAALLFNPDGPEHSVWLLEKTDFHSLPIEAATLEIIVGILLSIDEFQLASRLLRMPESPATYSLRLMRFASAVRGPAFLRDEDLEVLLSELRSFWLEVSDQPGEASRLCLGFGYVAFHLWQKSGAAIRIDRPEDPLGAARFSLEVVHERLDQLHRDALVLGVNHVVYVEAVTGLRLEDGALWAQMLREQARATGHYRLYDTLGWREYLNVLRDGKDESLRGECVRLERALEDLRTAWRGVYRDREVEDHFEAISEAYSSRCPPESRKGFGGADNGTQRSSG